MAKQQPLSDDDRADLVAYLDGELDEEASRALESKLSLDPKARAEADSLKRTWDLLDFLPRPEPSPSFTHRTMDRLTPVKTSPLRLGLGDGAWRWAFAAGWAAALLVSAAVGYSGMKWWQTRARTHRDQDLVRDLRIIENKRLYDHADDIEFVRQLDHPDLFGDDQPGS